MKKSLLVLALCTAPLAFSQNKFLAAAYWKAKPALATVKADVAAGNNPAELNRYRYNAVVQAILGDEPLEVVQYLISATGNDVNFLTGHDRSYLHYAAMKNRADLIEFLLKSGADMYREDTLGTTALEYGAWLGQLQKDGFEKFFAAGYPVLRKNADGANALMLSAFKENESLETTKYLLSKGIPANDKDNAGRVFMDYAARGGKVSVMQAMTKENYPHTDQALVLAASGFRNVNTLPVLKFLVEDLKINPSATAPDGKNALHLLAAWPKSEEQTAYFISKGVRVSAQDEDGNTPILIAAKNRDKTNLAMMFSQKKDKTLLNIPNKKGETPLMSAAKYSAADTLQFLLENGANPDAKDAEGNGLEAYLAESYKIRGKSEIDVIRQKISLLKSRGYDFSQKNSQGNTFLHLAAAQDSPELLDLAYEVYKGINTVNDDGFSPLMMNAVRTKNTESLQKIMSWGADKNIRSDMGETAFSLAADNKILQEKKAEIAFLK